MWEPYLFGQFWSFTCAPFGNWRNSFWDNTSWNDGETKEEKNRREFTITEQLKKMDESNDHLSVVSTDIKQLVDLANKQLVVSTLTEKEKGDSRKKITGDSGGFSASSYQYI